jgi:hypothetical protein
MSRPPPMDAGVSSSGDILGGALIAGMERGACGAGRPASSSAAAEEQSLLRPAGDACVSARPR